jgi:16S rRNA (cytidine1402-2'-O)-methyltransferase
VVATPIGNLADITLRALEILKQVDRIACEDTRHSLGLLNHYGIHKPLFSIFGPKEKKEVPRILEFLSQGETLALLTDAGTPGISDPGGLVVQKVQQAGFEVRPIPGVCALGTVLSVCGYAQQGCVFLGFLPRDKGKIKKRLQTYIHEERPIVFYESPFRVLKTLKLAREVFGEPTFCFLGREMTKKFEEFLSGSLDKVIQNLENREIRGEFTLVLKRVGS